MAFKIIRNDITKVAADAIVNTANPAPVYAAGTDAAIYLAAGEEALLAERRKIGDIKVGDAATTPAFALPAKYIIHTVGPAWWGGEHGERELVRSCYENSLRLALELGCESIAFPLIATGTYGFPKSEALQIAISVFSQFLSEHDMQITLVVFDEESFVLSGKIFAGIDAYIDEKYVDAQFDEEYGVPDASISLQNSIRQEEDTDPQRKSLISRLGLFRRRNKKDAFVDEEEQADISDRSFLKPEKAERRQPDGESHSAFAMRKRPVHMPEEVELRSQRPFREAAGINTDTSRLELSLEEDPEIVRDLVRPDWSMDEDLDDDFWERGFQSEAPRNDPSSLPDNMPDAPAGSSQIRSSARVKASKTMSPAAASGFQHRDKTPKTLRTLDDLMAQVAETWQESLLRLIDEKGYTDTEVYKRANVDRKLFSKIRCNPAYQPKKITAVAFALALQLNLDETKDLLSRAGYALSPSSRFDLIVEYFIEQKVYDTFTINLALFDHQQPLIGG